MTSELRVEVSLADQRLVLYCDGVASESFPVSTAKNGPGERMNSLCTPRGAHVIAAGTHAWAEADGGRRVGFEIGSGLASVGAGTTYPVTAARNLEHALEYFTTVNLDFLQHYRPRENVVRRPTLGGGQGYALTGHHEILLPLLAAALVELE